MQAIADRAAQLAGQMLPQVRAVGMLLPVEAVGTAAAAAFGGGWYCCCCYRCIMMLAGNSTDCSTAWQHARAFIMSNQLPASHAYTDGVCSLRTSQMSISNVCSSRACCDDLRAVSCCAERVQCCVGVRLPRCGSPCLVRCAVGCCQGIKAGRLQQPEHHRPGLGLCSSRTQCECFAGCVNTRLTLSKVQVLGRGRGYVGPSLFVSHQCVCRAW